MINLLHGDCLEMMKSIEDGFVDMILVDPPYGTTSCRWDSIIPLDEMWIQLKRIIKNNGAIVMTAQTPFDKVLGCSNLKMLRYEWIWYKNKGSGHLNAKKMPMKHHENVLVFYSKLPTYNPQKTLGHKPMNDALNTGFSENYRKMNKANTTGGSTVRHPRSVQEIPVFNNDGSSGARLHPTQKPVELMEYFIKTYTNESETVLDFTMGSGTTGIACQNLNRSFIGIEMDDYYFEVAEARIGGDEERLQYLKENNPK